MNSAVTASICAACSSSAGSPSGALGPGAAATPPPVSAGAGAGSSAGASEPPPLPENSRKLNEVATIATTATTAISASQNRRRRAAVSSAVSGTANSSGRGSPASGSGRCEPSVIVTSPRRCPARSSSDQRHRAELPVPVLAYQIHPHHLGDLAGALAGGQRHLGGSAVGALGDHVDVGQAHRIVDRLGVGQVGERVHLGPADQGAERVGHRK